MGLILSMRQAIWLWDLAMAGDAEELGERIHWEGESLFYTPRADWMLKHLGKESWDFFAGDHWSKIRHAELFQERVVLLRENRDRSQFQRLHGDLVGAGLLAMMRIVDEWLWGGLGLRLDEDMRTGRPVLRHWPGNLADALWFQFTTAVSESRRYRKCAECQSWFEIPLRGARISKEYCSNACRSAAYRRRQERARQLHGQGRSFKEIAQELGTDVKTVKGWVSR
jgi:hypothetical protein